MKTKNNKTIIQSIFFLMLLNLSAFQIKAQNGNIIFSVGPSLKRTKMSAMTSLLNDGNVISFGGRESGFISSSYSDFYDAQTNTFSESPMNFIHDFPLTVKLNDGNFFIAGSAYDWGVPGTDEVEVYDITSKTFTAKQAMSLTRASAYGAQLKNGKILIAGAWYNATSAVTPEIYDLSGGGSSTLTGSLITARAQPLVLPTSDSGAVVASGYPSFGGNWIKSVEYYSPNTNDFTLLSNVPIPSDTDWVVYAPILYTIEDLKMNNGNYLLLGSRATPNGNEYGLIEFNPDTKQFSLVQLNKSLRDSLTDGGYLQYTLNKQDNIAYLLSIDSGYTTQQRIGLVTVDLNTGDVFIPTTTLEMPQNEYMNGFFHTSMTYLSASKSILVKGISEEYDNFTATDKTYIFKPTIQVGVQSKEKENKIKCYPNPTNNNLNIDIISSSYSKTRISLFDITGKQIINIDKDIVSGINNLSLDTHYINNGVYFLNIQNNELNETHKIVISK